MNLSAWLAERSPRPPDAIRDRILEVARADDVGAGDRTRALVELAERTAVHVLHTEDTSRRGALELLVADALVTYAFEGAADDPASLDVQASDALRRLSLLAAEP